MKIGELIKKLEEIGEQYGPEVRVFTKGYEGGYQDVLSVDQVDDFLLDVNKEWWYGPHERMKHIDESIKQNHKQVKGVVL